MNTEKICINGIIKEPDDALVLATNLGLSSGIGVFETFRVNEGKVFLLNEHFARLQKSLKALGLSAVDETQARNNIFKIAKLAKPGHDARVRFTVAEEAGGELTSIIYMSSIPLQEPSSKEAVVLKKITRHQPEYFKQTGFRIKSLDYTYASFAQTELDKGQAGIMLSPDGYVAEGLTSNIFWAIDGQLFTSPLSLGILPGIIRGYLIRNNQVREKFIKADELEEVDEIFLTNSVGYLMSINSIDGIKKPGTKGQVFLDLYDQISKSIKI